jgi:3-methyladenine DNA glycosylase AlkD
VAKEKQNARQIVGLLRKMASKRNRDGMARFGISVNGTLGVSVPKIREIAKDIGVDQEISLLLWKTGVHEARLLAGFVGDPTLVREKQMEMWVRDFDSWDVVDQVCSNLFDKTPYAWEKAVEWTARKEEYVKRAGFVLMACLSVHDKGAKDSDFDKFFPIMAREAHDSRNFVKKAVNWALRQIGKRNLALNRRAILAAKKIAALESPSAKWIAADALRELESDAVQKRLREKEKKGKKK